MSNVVKKVELSVVIPTYNEEKYLPNLLNCLKKQTYKNFEVIVADKKGKDKTREIARKFGAKVVDGGSVSVGRNNGAKVAKGKYICFFDADVIFDNNFLETNLKYIKRRDAVAVSCWALWYDKTQFWQSVLIYPFSLISNIVLFISQKRRPFVQGFYILVRKDVFDKVKGFNKKLIFGEDTDLIFKMAKYGRFYFHRKTKIYSSPRRFVKLGIFRLIFKYIIMNLSRYLFGNKSNYNYFDDNPR